jgi:uncharacterized repeat protein (TIGR03803 family)
MVSCLEVFRHSSNKSNAGFSASFRMVAAVLALAPLWANCAWSQTSEKVLYNFNGGSDGAEPTAGLISDPAGSLYGTTLHGGPSNAGTVFKLDPAGNETVLYSFTGFANGADGENPKAGVVRDSVGNLYGTTWFGGANNGGSVFKVDPTGKETLLYSFANGSDGGNPGGGLIQDSQGNLYGTTHFGGVHGAGTIFRVGPTGIETVLYSFTGGSDGSQPNAGVTRDASGNLYGTTQFGGASGAGTVFKLDTSGVEAVLHSFTNGLDGGTPLAPVIQDAKGNLYGTTVQGGSGYGVVFKVDLTGAETPFYTFTGGSDGAAPYPPVIQDAAGNLYGMTYQGGTHGYGVVFKVDPTGHESVLYNFAENVAEAVSEANLLLDSAGNLYGTTRAGGTSNNGTVFEIPLQAQQVVFNFTGGAQTWVVPNGIASISVDARGGAGGDNELDAVPLGGRGGRVQTTIAVTAGETLTIYVAGRGGDPVAPNTAGLGGFNGGGNGGIDNVDANSPSAGGGGASDVRQGGNDLAHRVVVAGGGGGAECCQDGNGGAGGGLIGMAGGGGQPGGGGKQTVGGVGGGDGTSGSLGQGGLGGDGNRAGGGGGGGHYGGGGGAGDFLGSGGGGGSSHSAGTHTLHTQGYQTGNGQVVINFGSAGSSWQPLKHQPTFNASTALLLTDGTVMVQDAGNTGSLITGNWWRLTPDGTSGANAYVNGIWTWLAPMPSGYGPKYYASAVLADGKAIVEGGEYNLNQGQKETMQGAIYDPTANSWALTAPPTGWEQIGDAASVVLPDGTFMIGNSCTASAQNCYKKQAKLNGTAFVEVAGGGKADSNSEEGWTLLPGFGGFVLTVDVLNTMLPMHSERYLPRLDKWVSAATTPAELVISNYYCADPKQQQAAEIGPALLLPDGTVFATGGTGNTAIYRPLANTWSAGPTFPTTANGQQLGIADGPGALLPNGKVLVQVAPVSPCYDKGSEFYEFDYNSMTLNPIPSPPNAGDDPSYYGRMVLLPTGQVLFTDGTTDVEIYTPSGTPQAAWAPTIKSLSSKTITPGQTYYKITGTQFNGLSQGAAYGDDAQAATNYPLVRIQKNKSKNVFYAKTHDHSTMGVATGSTTLVYTYFDAPSNLETGASTLVVVANGIPSKPVAVTVQ